MPLPLDVTRSIGIGTVASGFSLRKAAMVALVPSMSLFDVGPKFVPPVEVGSYPFPAADGRPRKYCGFVHSWPMIAEPTGFPFTYTIDPFACDGNASCAMPVMTNVYSKAKATTERTV